MRSSRSAPRRILASIISLFVASVFCEGNVPHAGCQTTVTAQKGDTCASLSSTWGISVTTFLHNNPQVQVCSKLAVGSSYCIDAVDSQPVPNNGPDAGPAGGMGVSTDGSCGSGITCAGSKFGDCCSAHGWCGGTADHCGDGCQALFGNCNGKGGGAGSSPVPSSANPPASQPPVETAPSPPRTTAPNPNNPDAPIGAVRTVYTTVVQTSTSVKLSTSMILRTQVNTLPATVYVSITNTAYSTLTRTEIASVTNTRTAVVQVTSTASAWVTSTAITTSTSRHVVTVTSTQIAYQTAEESTVVTSTVLRTQRVTRTMTQTEIDTSIITTITTVTLFVSQTNAPAGEWCTRVSRQATQVNDARIPTPTQAGVVNNCKQYYEVQSGDYCMGIVERFNRRFSLQEFYRWNQGIGNNCERLYPGYYVCVGVTDDVN